MAFEDPAILVSYRRWTDRWFPHFTRSGALGAAVGLLVLAVLAFFDVRFDMNDDHMLLHSIMAGWDVRYMSLILGRALSFLYRYVHASVPWYGLLLYLVHAASIFLFLWSLKQLRILRYYFLPLTGLYVSLYVLFLLRISWNASSIMIGANSLAAFLIYWGSGRKKLLPAALLGILFACSYLIRMQSIVGVTVFALPLLALAFIRLRLQRIALPALFLLPVGLFLISDRMILMNTVSSEYQAFAEFNALDGRFHDFPVHTLGLGKDDALRANHWSENDYNLLSSWLYFDETVFNVSSMRNLLIAAPRAPATLVSTERLGAAAGALAARYYGHGLVILLLLGIGAAATWRPLPLVLYVLYAFGGMLYLETVYRFPPRIGNPFFLTVASFLLAMIYFVKPENERASSPGSRLVPTAIGAAVLLMAVNIAALPVKFLKKGETNFGPKQGNIQYYLSRNFPGKMLLVYPVVPFDPLYHAPLRFDFIPTAWEIFSPKFYGALKRAGIGRGHQLGEAMIDSDRFYVVLNHPSILSLMQTYYTEHLPHRNAAFIPVDRFGNNMIFRVVSDPDLHHKKGSP